MPFELYCLHVVVDVVFGKGGVCPRFLHHITVYYISTAILQLLHAKVSEFYGFLSCATPCASVCICWFLVYRQFAGIVDLFDIYCVLSEPSFDYISGRYTGMIDVNIAVVRMIRY